jgi:inorganic triphosphatase YgiF
MTAAARSLWFQKFGALITRVKCFEAAIEYSASDYLLDRLTQLDQQVAQLRAEIAASRTARSETGDIPEPLQESCSAARVYPSV